VSTRPGRHVIENISYRDDFWREEFFVFKVDRASVGDFDFSRLQRNWITGIARLGQSSFSDQVRGLLHAFRCGQVQWESFSMDRIRSAFLLPRGEGIAPTIGEVTPTSGWLEASSSEPPQDLALTRSSRRRPRRSSFHASRSILRIGTGSDAPQAASSSFFASKEREAYAKIAAANSVALDIRRILRELDIAKLEGKRDAEKIKAMIEDWERLSFERAMFESEVTAQKVRIDELKSERDRDVRRA
ncbi:unnamed protein product, partial [Brassica oleracea var. botrytis]